jgi:hypothetical protein
MFSCEKIVTHSSVEQKQCLLTVNSGLVGYVVATKMTSNNSVL